MVRALGDVMHTKREHAAEALADGEPSARSTVSSGAKERIVPRSSA